LWSSNWKTIQQLIWIWLLWCMLKIFLFYRCFHFMLPSKNCAMGWNYRTLEQSYEKAIYSVFSWLLPLALKQVHSPRSYLFSYSIMNLDKDVNSIVFYFHIFHSRGQCPFLD
jgi:hypothetical protein